MTTFTTNDVTTTDFILRVSFNPGKSEPIRLFETISNIIASFHNVDSHLIKAYDFTVTTELTLQDIQPGSLKVFLRSTINAIDDEAYRNLDWKRAIGTYLLAGKRVIAKRLEDEYIKDKNMLLELQDELISLAVHNTSKSLIPPRPLDLSELLSMMKRISDSLNELEINEEAYLLTDGTNEIRLNKDLRIDERSVIDILSEHIEINTSIYRLKVRKPDFLGNTIWQFKLKNKNLDAKITDNAWLEKFQNRTIEVKPGDSIRAEVEETDIYDVQNDLISHLAVITKVLEVLPAQESGQSHLFGEDIS